MGEYAEMLLDGTCCEGCGTFMGDDGPGYVRYCSRECAEGRGVTVAEPRGHRQRYNGAGGPKGIAQPHGQGKSAKARRRRALRLAKAAPASAEA